MNYRCPESVLIVVYTADRVLLLQRKKAPVGVWQSVTGALEWNESPLQAAQRELYEETGIRTDRLLDTGISYRFEIVPESRHRYAPGIVENTEYVFVLALDAPCEIRFDTDEHEQYQWFTVEQAINRVWSWSNRQAIESLIPLPGRSV